MRLPDGRYRVIEDNFKDNTDEELVLGCSEGDDAAWAALVARYQRLIFSIPRRAGLDPEVSADIFQQTMLKLLQNIRGITQPSQIHAWLVTTARRETLLYLRKNKGSLQVTYNDEDGDPLADLASNGPLPDTVLLEMETQHRVRTAVARLDEKCRRLITLLFYGQETASYADIASDLGISEGSIGPNRARCLKKLQDLVR